MGFAVQYSVSLQHDSVLHLQEWMVHPGSLPQLPFTIQPIVLWFLFHSFHRRRSWQRVPVPSWSPNPENSSHLSSCLTSRVHSLLSPLILLDLSSALDTPSRDSLLVIWHRFLLASVSLPLYFLSAQLNGSCWGFCFRSWVMAFISKPRNISQIFFWAPGSLTGHSIFTCFCPQDTSNWASLELT